MLLALSFALSAHAGDFVAKLDKKPYVVKTALAMPDPERPWIWGALISDEAFTCEQFLSGEANRKVSSRTTNENGKTKTTTEVTGPSTDTRLVIMFAGSEPGTTSAFLMGSGKGGSDVLLDQRTVTVEANGSLAFDLKGKTFSATGSLPYTLCAPLGVRPTIAWTGAAADFTLRQISMFEDRPEKEFPVIIGLPEGWKYAPPNKEDYQVSPTWTAPDGMTVLQVTLQEPPSEFATSAAESATQMLDAMTGMKAVRNEAIGTGAWVLEFGNADRRVLDVRRFEPGWAYEVQCVVNADPIGAAAVFEAATKACSSLTAR